MKSGAIRLQPAQDVNHPFVQGTHTVCTLLKTRLGYQIDCQVLIVLVCRKPLLYLIMVPKSKSSDAGNSDMPTRSCKMLPLSEKACMYRQKYSI